MSETVVREVALANPLGLHARPCHSLVTLAQSFQSEIRIQCEGRTADASSILALMTLGAVEGASIRVDAEGPDAGRAVDAICLLIESEEGG